MRGTLQRLRPILVDLIPPDGARMIGTTAQGLPIYQETIVRAGPVEPMLDTEGKEVWVKHPTTGEPMYRRNTRKPVSRTRFIVPNQQGNGNLSWDEYNPPTATEIQAKERREKIEHMKDNLAAVLVDQDLTPERLAELVKGPVAAKVAVVEDEVPDVVLTRDRKKARPKQAESEG